MAPRLPYRLNTTFSNAALRATTTSSHNCRKLALVIALLFALWLVSDDSMNAYMALQQHEPSWRIFRSLLQVNLGLWCAAISLAVFRRIVSAELLDDLFFQPAPGIARSAQLQMASPRSHHDEEHEERDHELTLQQEDNEPSPSCDEPPSPTTTTTADIAAVAGVFRDATMSSAPSVESVISAAFDNLLIVLVVLFLFTLFAAAATNDNDVTDKLFLQTIAAPTFPLLLFVYSCVAAVVPWKRRRHYFWAVVAPTLWAPWPSPVTFRDSFIGDVLTSSVRPLQDLAFTMCYILFGLKGWWSAAYMHTPAQSSLYAHDDYWNATLLIGNNNHNSTSLSSSSSASFIASADASVPEMETSWLVHTVVLPTCMISPLWCRFLQNLRQSYDNKTRWPYLGNAFKYFLAAQVAMFGIYHPGQRNEPWWIVAFVVATVYQIIWDVFMDWELLERNTRGQWQLRQKRLYARTSVYWSICIINVLLRFCWSLSFLPMRYLNAAGRLTENFGDGLGAIFGPSLASAEIIRRSLWGLLRFEWEAIKEVPDSDARPRNKMRRKSNKKYASVVDKDMHDDDSDDEHINHASDDDDEGHVEMTPMDMVEVNNAGQQNLSMSSMSARAPWWKSDMSSMNDVQILGELCLYATVFVLVGAIAAAHRETL
jgi:hypothetical protein